MTSPYYDDPVVSTYDPECTFHNDDIVRLNKTVKPKRGDVAVFYKYHVDSKFKAMFAHGDDAGEDGKYEKLIKRIVALAGDSLWLEAQGANEYKLVVQTVDGDVLYEDYYVKNDHVLDVEAFILSDNTIAGTGCLKNTDKEHPHIVQEGCFFAMGDNRGNSADSRGSLGDVPYDQIYGIVRS